MEQNPKQAALVDYFAEKSAVIERTHDFWLKNRKNVVIESNKAEIEAAHALANKSSWVSSIKSILGTEEVDTTRPSVVHEKIEKYIAHTPFIGDNAVRGTYVWGDTGSGKTFLCDLFYDALPINEKQRLHYNKFMLAIHASNFKHYNVNLAGEVR